MSETVTKVDLIANELSEPRMNMATGNVILNGKLLASGGKYSGRREPTNEKLLEIQARCAERATCFLFEKISSIN